IATLAFLILSLMCSLSSPFLVIMYPRYLYFLTSSNLSFPHHQNLSFSLPPLFLNTMTFDFSVLISNFFSSRYFLNLLIISLRPSSPSATNMISSAYSIDQTLSFPILTPPLPFFNSSSMSAKYILNKVGLKGHPCLTPFSTQNSFDTSSPIFTTHRVSSYISSTLCIRSSFIFRFLIISHKIFLSNLSKAAFRSTNKAYTLSFFFIPFPITCFNIFIFSTVPLPFLNPACDLLHPPFSSKSFTNLLFNIFAYILYPVLVSVTPLWFAVSFLSPLFQIGTTTPTLHFSGKPSPSHTLFITLPTLILIFSPPSFHASFLIPSNPAAFPFFNLFISIFTSS
ncbi:hypothetical protein ALC56_04098, partial [Trachymyrmex septentrionalis]